MTWWLIHNCIAHPMLGVAPRSQLVGWFHDWTATKMNDTDKDTRLATLEAENAQLRATLTEAMALLGETVSLCVLRAPIGVLNRHTALKEKIRNG